MSIRVCVPKELKEGEQRVALVPDVVKRLLALNIEVSVQAGAGEAAGFGDEDYVGAQIVQDDEALYAAADILLTVNPLSVAQLAKLK